MVTLILFNLIDSHPGLFRLLNVAGRGCAGETYHMWMILKCFLTCQSLTDQFYFGSTSLAISRR